MNRPLLLLLGTGFTLGLNFPLGKLAIAAGVEPALWAAWISLGAGVALWIVTMVTEKESNNAADVEDPTPTPPQERGSRNWPLVPPTSPATGEGDHAKHGGGGDPMRSVLHSPPPPPSAVPLPRSAGEEPARHSPPVSVPSRALRGRNQRPALLRSALLRYAVISGFLSYVVPNFLTFSAIPKIGSGLAAIMYALSPVTTAALSTLLKVRPPSAIGLLGIALGLLGALVIVVFRGASFSVGSGFWLALALLVPVFLAIGNVYRTVGWPEGASPRRLASITNLAAVPPLLIIAFALNGTLDVSQLLAAPELAALQIAVSTTMFLMFFRLQQLGGPTYLSQIGYVTAAVAVFVGVVWLGEKYPMGVWVGTAIIAMGIGLSTYAQVRKG